MSTATARRDEVAADLAQTKEQLAAARAALGRAVATGADAAKVRREVFDLQSRVSELEAALPAAEDLIREEQARAAAERQAVEAAAREERRKKREAAAKRFDVAIKAAGVAFDEWQAAGPEGIWMGRLSRSLPFPLALALGHFIAWDEAAPLAAGEKEK